MRLIEYERPHLIVTPRAVWLLEAAPGDHVIPRRYLDPEIPATRLTAHTSEDGDLALGAVVVVVRRRLVEQMGRGQKDVIGW